MESEGNAAQCGQQQGCAVWVKSHCSDPNVEDGLPKADCTDCYKWTPAQCKNLNPAAVSDAGSQTGSSALEGVNTEEECMAQRNACIFEERGCAPLSDYHATRSATTSSRQACEILTQGCEWFEDYTFITPCTFTAAVAEKASSCSDVHGPEFRFDETKATTNSFAPPGSFEPYVRPAGAVASYTSCSDGKQNGPETGVDCGGAGHYDGKGEVCEPCKDEVVVTEPPTTQAPNTTAAASTAAATTAAPTAGPVEVAPAAHATASLFTFVLLAVSALLLRV